MTELLFNNMIAQILFQGRILEETISIKNIIRKGEHTFFDVYFYRTGQNRLIDASYFRNLYDSDTCTGYKDIDDFINRYNESQTPPPQQEEIEEESGLGFLDDLQNELIILYFLANINGSFHDIKLKVINDYVQSYSPEAKIFSEQFLETYLKKLDVDEENYLMALNNLKDAEKSLQLFNESAKITSIDGSINAAERLYLAEFTQHLRNHSLHINIHF